MDGVGGVLVDGDVELERELVEEAVSGSLEASLLVMAGEGKDDSIKEYCLANTRSRQTQNNSP